MAHELMAQAQSAGCLRLDGHEPSPEELRVKADAQKLVADMRRVIESAQLAELYKLFTYYDLLHRVAYCRPVDKAFRADVEKRFFSAWTSGDSEISEADVYAMVAPKVRANMAGIDNRYLATYKQLKRGWVKELQTTGKFTATTAAESYARLTQLISDELSDVVEGGKEAERAFKQRIVEANTDADLDADLDMIISDNARRGAYRLFMQRAEFLGLLRTELA